jgi:hypothetical protein
MSEALLLKKKRQKYATQPPAPVGVCKVENKTEPFSRYFYVIASIMCPKIFFK